MSMLSHAGMTQPNFGENAKAVCLQAVKSVLAVSRSSVLSSEMEHAQDTPATLSEPVSHLQTPLKTANIWRGNKDSDRCRKGSCKPTCSRLPLGKACKGTPLDNIMSSVSADQTRLGS